MLAATGSLSSGLVAVPRHEENEQVALKVRLANLGQDITRAELWSLKFLWCLVIGAW